MPDYILDAVLASPHEVEARTLAAQVLSLAERGVLTLRVDGESQIVVAVEGPARRSDLALSSGDVMVLEAVFGDEDHGRREVPLHRFDLAYRGSELRARMRGVLLLRGELARTPRWVLAAIVVVVLAVDGWFVWLTSGHPDVLTWCAIGFVAGIGWIFLSTLHGRTGPTRQGRELRAARSVEYSPAEPPELLSAAVASRFALWRWPGLDPGTEPPPWLPDVPWEAEAVSQLVDGVVGVFEFQLPARGRYNGYS
ncbi:hypothetical protein AB0M43_07360 [Longispora sp. NPDC051575]|uniref:hypothetical protein n=1 Tax=Longispora sp. NPDC051575 TaxID=3154943 RepID=UPI00341F36C9